eukprot:TRINITY_DN18406_c0_g1_i2.p1 TRINITY_DN18406_c0_g1~~TRINITY_DN18406_c0_g1_i2.p1  ORF type:complete len:107 (+),score=3.77 TRINITY_DN18406_c0_g1_i2:55-375(+)
MQSMKVYHCRGGWQGSGVLNGSGKRLNTASCGLRPRSAEEFLAVVRAFEVLSNADAHQAYDMQRGLRRHAFHQPQVDPRRPLSVFCVRATELRWPKTVVVSAHTIG